MLPPADSAFFPPCFAAGKRPIPSIGSLNRRNTFCCGHGRLLFTLAEGLTGQECPTVLRTCVGTHAKGRLPPAVTNRPEDRGRFWRVPCCACG